MQEIIQLYSNLHEKVVRSEGIVIGELLCKHFRPLAPPMVHYAAVRHVQDNRNQPPLFQGWLRPNTRVTVFAYTQVHTEKMDSLTINFHVEVSIEDYKLTQLVDISCGRLALNVDEPLPNGYHDRIYILKERKFLSASQRKNIRKELENDYENCKKMQTESECYEWPPGRPTAAHLEAYQRLYAMEQKPQPDTSKFPFLYEEMESSRFARKNDFVVMPQVKTDFSKLSPIPLREEAAGESKSKGSKAKKSCAIFLALSVFTSTVLVQNFFL